jgi:hypothetical protein
MNTLLTREQTNQALWESVLAEADDSMSDRYQEALRKIGDKSPALYTIAELSFINEHIGSLNRQVSWGADCREEADIVLKMIERLEDLAKR